MSLELVIVTPEGQAYSGTVDQVVLPGSEGEFGVLESHERTLAPLQHGAVEIKTASGSEWIALSNGFADVGADRVVVLADSCVLASAIDKDAVQAELSEAQTELSSLGDDEANGARRATLAENIAQCEAQLVVAAK
ncbi:MAG: F-type H+-transporting ATPase subunit epsilon [Myxococcota bacterium]